MQGKHTVPNVWINGKFVGGADDLEQLESSGNKACELLRQGDLSQAERKAWRTVQMSLLAAVDSHCQQHL